MVGVVHDDDLAAAGVGAGEPQRQIVGLGPGAHEITDRQRIGQGGREARDILGQIVVKVAGVGVEELPSGAGRRHDHAGVAVAHVADVVDQVEVAAAVVVKEVLALAADDLEWGLVRDAQVVAEMAASHGDDLL